MAAFGQAILSGQSRLCRLIRRSGFYFQLARSTRSINSIVLYCHKVAVMEFRLFIPTLVLEK